MQTQVAPVLAAPVVPVMTRPDALRELLSAEMKILLLQSAYVGDRANQELNEKLDSRLMMLTHAVRASNAGNEGDAEQYYMNFLAI